MVGSLSAFLWFSHPLTLTSPGYWDTLGNKRSVLPGETISLLVWVRPKYSVQVYKTCTDTALSGYQFTLWSSGAWKIHLCTEKLILRQGRRRTRDLSNCNRTRYHWTIPPPIITCTRIEKSFKYIIMRFNSLAII